jgi:hypothetical protein
VTLLVHPVTGGRVDVRPQAVGIWRRSGWATPEDLAAPGQAADTPPGGDETGRTEPAGEVTDGATAA